MESQLMAKCRPLFVLAALGLVPTVQAQVLEEVVVTATRREESAQTVPVSITAISAAQLSDAGVAGIRDLGTLTPGLNMNARSNVWIPFIRGIGAGDTSGGQESGVAIYVDGVYMSSPHAGQFNFDSIDRVEVLKGPQGTLFGRNATGGLIQVITKDPTQKTEAFAKVSYGSYETSAISGYLGGGITPNLTADITVQYGDQGEGYGYNLFGGQRTRLQGDRDKGFRSKWIWTPTDATKVTFAVDSQRHDTNTGDDRSLLPGSVAFDGTTKLGGFYDVNYNFPTYGFVENSGAMLKVQQNLSFANFVSITAYRKLREYNSFDNDALPTSVVEAQQYLRVNTFTQELQLLSKPGGKLDWIVGAFFMHDLNGYVAPGGLKLNGVQVTGTAAPVYVELMHSMDTQSIAGFAETTWHFDASNRLVTGVRVTRDQKRLAGEIRLDTTAVGGGISVLSANNVTDNPPSASWTKPSVRIAYQHDFAKDIMGYASFNRGFRAGTYNTVGVTGVPINPETDNAYEIGLKSQWFDNRLRFNAAAYYTDYQGLQVVISRGPTTDTLNAGAARIEGLELDLEAAVTDQLTLRAATSLISSKYTQFVSGDLCSIRNNLGQTTLGPVCSPQGNELLRTPKETVNLGLNYKVPVGYGTLQGDLDYFWTAKFNWELDGRLVEPAYGLLNGRISWEHPNQHFGVAAYGKNLTGTKYSSFDVSQAGSRGGIGIGDQYVAGAPLTWGVELNFKL
jgi:iron complex outermembrane recepter protein